MLTLSRSAMTGETRELKLPAALCEAAEERFGESFGSLEQLLAFVLEQLLQDHAARMDEDERKIIQQRLKDLGYV